MTTNAEIAALTEEQAKGALAEFREWLRREEVGYYDNARAAPGEGYDTARRALTQAIKELDRISAKRRLSLGRRANDLQEALRLQGVHLGPDATEAVVKALASLEGDAS